MSITIRYLIEDLELPERDEQGFMLHQTREVEEDEFVKASGVIAYDRRTNYYSREDQIWLTKAEGKS